MAWFPQGRFTGVCCAMLHTRCVPHDKCNEINGLHAYARQALSAFADSSCATGKESSGFKDLRCRWNQTARALPRSGLEAGRFQLVAGQQGVEVGAVAPRQFGRLGYIAIGDFEHLG